MNKVLNRLTFNMVWKTIHSLLLLIVFVAQANAVDLLGNLGGSSGYGTIAMSRNDDGSSGIVSLTPSFPNGINFFGTTYTSLYINNNGNVTFKSPVSQFTPDPFPISSLPMIAAYWSDVDTRGSVAATEPAGSNNVYYSFALPGKFVATWFNVGYYSSHVNKLNSFQIIITDRPDTGLGNADVEFRYNRLEWTTGDASSGSNGLGGTPAQIGFDAGDLKNFFAHPDSRTAKVLDAINTTNVSIPGVWRFELRAGTVVEPPKNMLKNVVAKIYLPASGVSVDASSYKKLPDSNTVIGNERVLEWRYATLLASQIEDLSFDLTLHSPLGGEQRKVIYKATLDYIDINNKPVHAELDEQTVTVLASQYAGTIATDQTSYKANTNIQFTSLIQNKGQFAATATASITILAPDNKVVATLAPIAINALAAGATSTFSHSWNTQQSYVGQYKAILEVTDSITGNKSVAEAIFNIIDTDGSDAGIGLASGVDKRVYRVNDRVLLENFINNKALNAVRSGVSLVTKVLSPNGAAIYENSANLPDLAPNSYTENNQTINLVDAEAGEYSVTVSLYSAQGDLLVTDLLHFQVEQELTDLINGEIKVGFATLNKGHDQTCEFIVKNVGNSLYDNLTVVKSLVEFESQSIINTEQETISLPIAAALSDENRFSTNNLAPGTYACVLEAMVHGQNIVLATSLFTLAESPIKLNGNIHLGEKARLLILMDASASERSYLENLLTNAGWFYTIVDNATAFATEMSQGGYGVYALLSEKVTLDQTTQISLNAKVAAGDGLFVAGAADRRHQTLEQALGIKARANEAYAKGVVVKDSALGLGWQRAFNKSSQVLNFTANGATVLGEYKNDLPGADTQTILGALGAAGRYGNFVADNFTSLSSTVEGRLAVGGNLNLQNFSVGDKLDPNKLHDVVVVGGNVIFPSGRIYYGNLLAGGSVTGVGDAVRFGMAPGAVIKGNATMPVNFSAEREYLQELSANLSALPANGTVKMQWGGLELKGDCTSSLQVFNVNGADLGVAHTFAVSCVPSTATVVFNISGQSVSIKSMGMQSLTAIRDKVLFNFPQATSLSMTSVGIEGSLLAPFAQVNQPAGRVDGQVIVKTWYSTTNGYMSIHNRFFGGDLSAAFGPSSKNALSIYQYQQGRTIFAGFDVLAQAVASGAGNENPFAQLLLSALDYANPAPILARAGKTLPVVVTYENIGAQAVSGQVKLSMSGNVNVIHVGSFSAIANSNDWIAPLSLDAGATRGQVLYVKLPQSGGGSIKLQLQTGASPDWDVRFEKTLTLQP